MKTLNPPDHQSVPHLKLFQRWLPEHQYIMVFDVLTEEYVRTFANFLPMLDPSIRTYIGFKNFNVVVIAEKPV